MPQNDLTGYRNAGLNLSGDLRVFPPVRRAPVVRKESGSTQGPPDQKSDLAAQDREEEDDGRQT